MKRPRFGPGTSTYYLAFAVLGIIAISVWLSAISIPLCLFVSLLWVLFCSLVVDPWFYPRLISPEFNADGRYVDIHISTNVFYMNNGGKVVVVGVVRAIGRMPIRLSVFDKHVHAWGKSCDGVRETFVQTMAGDLTVKKTDFGFRLSWTENESWEMGT